MLEKQQAAASLAGIVIQNAGRTAIVDCIGGRRFTYGELEDISGRLASVLSQVPPGGRIAFLLPNGVEMVVAYLACIQAGVTSVPINPDFHASEVQALLDMVSPDLLLADAGVMARLAPRVACPVLRLGGKEADHTLEAVATMPRLDEAMFVRMQDGDTAHIVLSSGTSGLAKAIPITLGNIIGHAAMFVRSHGLDETCRFYSALPLAFLGGWYNLTLVPFLCGGTIVLDRLFGANRMYSYWDTVLSQGVNCVWYTPSMLSALLAIGLEDPARRGQISRQVRWGMVGMAPLAPELKKRFEDQFGFRLQQSYGLSETFLFTSWMSDTSLPDASVGKCLDGYTIRITDMQDRPLPQGQEGEIRVKGRWIFSGYWRQDALTAAAFDAEGYFRTGDVGCFDAEGNLYITGRIKELIIRSGINIAPAEIENVLHAFPGVKEAAVIGVADPLYGEAVIAFVTTEGTLRPEAVLAFCRERLSAIKVPAAVHILPAMPLNASGKINKRMLKEQWHAEPGF